MSVDEFEEYLNLLYQESYTEEQVLEQCTYLGTDQEIKHIYRLGLVGTYMRKKSPVTFNTAYNETKS